MKAKEFRKTILQEDTPFKTLLTEKINNATKLLKSELQSKLDELDSIEIDLLSTTTSELTQKKLHKYTLQAKQRLRKRVLSLNNRIINIRNETIETLRVNLVTTLKKNKYKIFSDNNQTIPTSFTKDQLYHMSEFSLTRLVLFYLRNIGVDEFLWKHKISLSRENSEHTYRQYSIY